MKKVLTNNAQILDAELKWLEQLLYRRAEYTKHKKMLDESFLINSKPPTLNQQFSHYGNLLVEIYQDIAQQPDETIHHLVFYAKRIVLALAIVPHVKPQVLDIFFNPNPNLNREFTEFGGIKGQQHKGFLPTGETALYLLAGDNLELRFLLQQIFHPEDFFYKKNILRLESANNQEPLLSGQLVISEEYLQLLTTGEPYKPQYASNFPANYLTTQLEWDDLVLDYHTREEVEEVRAWIRQYKNFTKHKVLSKEIKGLRCLFYGESGTGKTLTTTLLGKEMNMDVYQIDLSKIVSKFIGETEKNLHNIFEMAKHRNWILFFDEGDALFGKRSETKSSNDRYANQETAYLLQKIEQHTGVIILATNIKANMDKAFLRRFQTEVYFGIPNEQTRLILFQKAFEKTSPLENKINLQDIARKYTLTGAAIKSIRNYCVVMAMDRKENLISYDDFMEGLKKQLLKEGKTI